MGRDRRQPGRRKCPVCHGMCVRSDGFCGHCKDYTKHDRMVDYNTRDYRRAYS